MIYGMILLWSGEIVDIPPGFALCDGNNGTPDLRDVFVIGAGGVLDPGNTGGANAHTHNFTSDGHSHQLTIGAPTLAAGTSKDNTTSTDTDTGTTDLADHKPPYHALAYIMYIGL